MSSNGQGGKRRIMQIKYCNFPLLWVTDRLLCAYVICNLFCIQTINSWCDWASQLQSVTVKKCRGPKFNNLVTGHELWLHIYTRLTINSPNTLCTVCHFWKVWKLLPAVIRALRAPGCPGPNDCRKSCLTSGHSSTDWWQTGVNLSPHTNLWVPPWTVLTGALARV